MKRKQMKRMMALTLAAAMAFSGAAITSEPALAAADTKLAEEATSGSSVMVTSGSSVTVTSGSSVTVTGPATALSFAPTKEGLMELVEANTFTNVDPSSIVKVRIDGIKRNDNIDELLLYGAQKFKMKKPQNIYKETTYQTYDMNKDGVKELFVLYPSGVREAVSIARYDYPSYGVKYLKKLNAVMAVYKNKKQIIVQQSGGYNSVQFTVLKLTNGGKIKTLAKYIRDGKKYKKNKKKISRKAYVKFQKSIKGAKEMKFKDVPSKQFEAVKSFSMTYLSPNVYINETEYDEYREATVVEKNDNEVSQNKRLAYTMTCDKVGKEFSSDPLVKRCVFGPDVVDPKTGKSYQEKDWEFYVGEKFGIDFAPDLLSASVTENNELTGATLVSGEIKNLKTYDDTALMDGDGHPVIEYTFDYGDIHASMKFFKSGQFAGRVCSVAIYLPSVKDDVPMKEWDFKYGKDAELDGQMYDPVIPIQVRGTAVRDKVPGAKDRVLVINDTTDPALAAYKQTITTNENVQFELLSGVSGQFYTYKEDGKTKWNLPLFDYDEKEQKTFDDMLNPTIGQLQFDQPKFGKGLFWEPK